MCTTTLAIGSRDLAKQGAIVVRLSSVEELAGMNILCSDKTGTLTLNTMVIQVRCCVFCMLCMLHAVYVACCVCAHPVDVDYLMRINMPTRMHAQRLWLVRPVRACW